EHGAVRPGLLAKLGLVGVHPTVPAPRPAEHGEGLAEVVEPDGRHSIVQTRSDPVDPPGQGRVGTGRAGPPGGDGRAGEIRAAVVVAEGADGGAGLRPAAGDGAVDPAGPAGPRVG